MNNFLIPGLPSAIPRTINAAIVGAKEPRIQKKMNEEGGTSENIPTIPARYIIANTIIKKDNNGWVLMIFVILLPKLTH